MEKGSESDSKSIKRTAEGMVDLMKDYEKSLNEIGITINKENKLVVADEENGVVAFTGDVPHNAITPIARRRGEDFELDLVLRNNLTSEEFPMGIYHPHADKHNIKKENIGLIEVMGLAILPARLKKEMARLGEIIISGGDPALDPDCEKHVAWLGSFKDNYTFTPENVEEILYEEIGKTFTAVLEDAGVYKATDEGRAAMMKFVEYAGGISC